MSYVPRSSFIPKEAPGAIPVQVKRRRSIHIISTIASLLLTLSILAAVGSFLYTSYLKKQLSEAQVKLDSVSSEDNTAKVADIKKYDKRLILASTLLNNHIAPSTIFDLLETSTESTVQFKSFEFSYDPGFEAVLTLGGVTEEFNSVTSQKRQFTKDEIFTEYVLTDIGEESEVSDSDSSDSEQSVVIDKVGFQVTGVFDIDKLKYIGDVSPLVSRSEVYNSSVETVDALQINTGIASSTVSATSSVGTQSMPTGSTSPSEI
jgi:hypothetical protein